MVDGPRGVKPGELDQLIELVHEVYNPRMRASFPTLFCEENLDNLRVIKTDEKFVSHIGIVIRDMVINGCRISVGNIGAVCTLEEYRKRGYAWAIFEDAMEKCRNEGVDMFLVSGFRTLYKLHGCTHVGKVARYSVNHDLPLPETSARARPFCPEDLPAWASLHISEPVRFQRPYDDFQRLTSGVFLNESRRLYSIWEGDSITAYLAATKGRESGVHFLEYAGSRQALLACVPTFCRDFERDVAVIPVANHDKQFQLMFKSIGIEASYGSTGGTITILDFSRLCQKMTPLFEEIVGTKIAYNLRFEEQNSLYSISLDDDQIAMDNLHDVARLIFGNPPDRDEHTEIKARGKLKGVLEAIFPIPRPEYGLSYI